MPLCALASWTVFVLQPAGAKIVKSYSFVLDPSGKLRRRVRRGTGRLILHLVVSLTQGVAIF